jgi:recombination protein RecR
MKSFDRLIRALRRLPGVGPRQAERFANYFLKASQAEAEEFINAFAAMRAGVRLCSKCFAYCEEELCPVCADAGRDAGLICVVEDPQDIEALEKTGAFKGLYHVLHGSLSPIEGRGQGSIKIRELIERVHDADSVIREVVIATDPDTEGETTALYIADALRGLVGKVTRIGYGVPLGGDIDYLDEMTLKYSLNSRTKL